MGSLREAQSFYFLNNRIMLESTKKVFPVSTEISPSSDFDRPKISFMGIKSIMSASCTHNLSLNEFEINGLTFFEYVLWVYALQTQCLSASSRNKTSYAFLFILNQKRIKQSKYFPTQNIFISSVKLMNNGNTLMKHVDKFYISFVCPTFKLLTFGNLTILLLLA